MKIACHPGFRTFPPVWTIAYYYNYSFRLKEKIEQSGVVTIDACGVTN